MVGPNKTGANSAVGLRSMTTRFVFLDEVDACPGDVAGEGDPIALAEARARTFGWRRKAFLVSTPTIAAGQSDARYPAPGDPRDHHARHRTADPARANPCRTAPR